MSRQSRPGRPARRPQASASPARRPAWTTIIAIPSLWGAVLSGVSDEGSTHTALIWTSLVGEVLVAIGILLEIQRPLNLKKVLSFAAVIIGVILGAAGTLLLLKFDEAISLLQQRTISAQNSTIIGLERKIAPRDLDDSQVESVASKIKQFSGMHFDLAMNQDLESMRLLDRIENALLSAGWQEQPPPAGITTFDRMSRLKVGIRTNAGVWVLYPRKSGEPFKSAATALSEALRAEGLIVALNIITGDNPYDLDKIHVWAGAKP